MEYKHDKYDKFIQSIIISRGQWSEDVKNSNLCERHHIIPKCFGGQPTNKDWTHHKNIIWLYPREHFIAHKLLAEENPDNRKLVYAFKCISTMGHNLNERLITEFEYEEIKTLYKSIPGPATGAKHNDEFKCNMSKRLKGHEVSEETRIKISKANSKPKPKGFSEKMSEILKAKFDAGYKPAWTGRHLTEEQKERCKITGSMSGSNTKWYTNGIKNKRIKIGAEIPDGYFQGRSNYHRGVK